MPSRNLCVIRVTSRNGIFSGPMKRLACAVLLDWAMFKVGTGKPSLAINSAVGGLAGIDGPDAASRAHSSRLYRCSSSFFLVNHRILKFLEAKNIKRKAC